MGCFPVPVVGCSLKVSSWPWPRRGIAPPWSFDTLVGNALPRISRTIITRAVAFLTVGNPSPLPPPSDDPVMPLKRRNEAPPVDQRTKKRTKKARHHHNRKIKQRALQKAPQGGIPQLRRKHSPLEIRSLSASTRTQKEQRKTNLAHSGLDRDNTVGV